MNHHFYMVCCDCPMCVFLDFCVDSIQYTFVCIRVCSCTMQVEYKKIINNQPFNIDFSFDYIYDNSSC